MDEFFSGKVVLIKQSLDGNNDCVNHCLDYFKSLSFLDS